MRTSLESLQIITRRLQPLNIPFTFIGGAVLGLLVDDAGLSQVRSTKDVDVVVEVLTYGAYAALEERLRRAGFQHDTTFSAPLCRWITDGCLVDILPAADVALGMNAKWFPEVLQSAQTKDLGQGCLARVVTPALFMATKLEAYKDRGQNDYLLSRDLGDIITLIDGRTAIVDDVRQASLKVRDFIRASLITLLKDPYFRDALPEHLPSLAGSARRLPLLLQRLEEITR